MSADIEKLAVFDSRIVQSRPRYAVEKGALSLTNAPFNAISKTASQHTYNIYVPSENVFVDRGVEWSATALMSTQVNWISGAANIGSATPTAKTPIFVPGVDFSLSAFPLNSLCSTMTATINDTTSVINSQDVLKEVLRLTDYKKNRLQRQCPTMLDKYQCLDDGWGYTNSTLSGFGSTLDYENDQNGAFPQIYFTDKNGNALVEGAYYDSTGTQLGAQPATAASTGVYVVINGIPSVATSVANTTCPGNSATDSQGNSVYQWTLFFGFSSTEKLVLSPFTFSDVHEWDTGLFGINNIQMIMNLQTPQRIVRYSGMRCSISSAGTASTASALSSGLGVCQTTFNSVASTAPFPTAVLNVQFLTPSLDVPLPPKSVVPYMEFPRYITTASQSIAPNQAYQIQSQTITLPQIPDLLIVYVKAALQITGQTQNPPNYGDFYLPLCSRWAPYGGQVAQPLTINFDNFSGLLSSHTTEELYGMSVKNGLDMDWETWSGWAQRGVSDYSSLTSSNGLSAAYTIPSQAAPGATTGVATIRAGRVPTAGSILVLKPSQDITLQTGQAPSLVGNFTLQFNLQVWNNTAYNVVPQLFVITANSGFFESIRGSSRIIKGVLSEQDIIGAPLAPTATRQELHRYVGGAGIMSSLANILSKVKGPALELLKEVGHHAGKELLHHGTEFAKKKLGLGEVSGGAASGGRKGLSARLM